MSFLEEIVLPDNNYGFIIEGRRDINSLKYLVSKVGEKKLLKSLAKYKNKWPDSSPYVSVILKWYNLKVPREAYLPTKVIVWYFIYIFSLKSKESCKIGFSIDPAQRMWKMHEHGFDVFNLQNSFIAPFATEKEARAAERKLKSLLQCDKKYSPYKYDEPTGFYWGSVAHTEWFNSYMLEIAKTALIEMSDRKELLTLNSLADF